MKIQYQFGSSTCLVLLVCQLVLADPVELLVAYETNEIQPYFYGNTADIPESLKGSYIDHVLLLERELDVKIKLVRYPWKRCLYFLGKGEVDAVVSASYKESRLNLARYPMKNGKPDTTRSLGQHGYSLFRLKGTNYSVNDGAIVGVGVREEPIAAQLGYSIVYDLKRKGFTIEEIDSPLLMLHKLHARRLTAAVLTTHVGRIYLHKNPDLQVDIEEVKPHLKMKYYYLVLSHQFVGKHPKLAEDIWDTLGETYISDVPEIEPKYELLW